ncbi:MAG: right-handed parallel beta-helix repeat-containing protein [bacterium]
MKRLQVAGSPWRALWLGIAVLVVAGFGPASAATWKVGRAAGSCDGPCNYDDTSDGIQLSIQYCLSRPATLPGDTVLVYPGDYIRGGEVPSGVVIRAVYGPDTTRIVGSASGEAAFLIVAGNPSTKIDGMGFTFDHNNALGGAIAAFVSGGTITNCLFDGCRASVGSAIYLQFSDMIVENNLFVDNETVAGGGTIAIAGGSPTIRNNTFARNRSPFGTEGASVYGSVSSFVLDRNVIWGSDGGQAVYCAGTNTPTVTCNIFWENAFGSFGGSCADSVGFSGNTSVDPFFCDPDFDDFGFCADSPALIGTCGTIGYASPGGNCAACNVVSVANLETRSWAGVKALYRN